jgi:mannose-6-phosphate isomerase-like protein (cupin superfamily)
VRRATPRPVYDSSRVIPYDQTAHHVWGDTESGAVFDRVYHSTLSLHCLEYQLPPRGEFRHSRGNPTVFGADVIYIVLEGDLVLANPVTGEVQPATRGQAVYFGRGTWHHGFNASATTPLRVLEFFSPPPARGTASDFATKQPYLDASTYRDGRWDGRWPAAADERAATRTLHLVDDATALWGFADASVSHMLATLVDTEHLTVRRGHLRAGHIEDFTPVDREVLLIATDGEVTVDIRDDDRYLVAVLRPGDGAYIAEGSAYRLLNNSADRATYILGRGCDLPDGWTPG